MCKRIYEILEVSNDGDKASSIYDLFMMITIFTSVIPLAFKEQNTIFQLIDKVSITIFILDYILRLLTSGFKLKKPFYQSVLIYPFTPMAIVDLLAILPSITALNSSFKLFKMLRLLRTFRVFRIFKAVRYSKNVMMIIQVFRKQKESLVAICVIASMYILTSALIILNVEPQTFDTYFDAVYWATVSLTTIGYGDIYPVTTIGRIITMLSSVLGIAIVAMPAGIITAGIIEEINKDKTS